MSKGGATAPARPRHGPGRAASRAWPRSTLGASAGTAARKGARRGGYGGWLLFFSSVPHRPGSAPQTAHGTAQREQPPSLGRNFTAASMGTLGGAAPSGAGGLQAPGPIMGPLIQIRGSGHRAPTTGVVRASRRRLTRAPTPPPAGPCYRARTGRARTISIPAGPGPDSPPNTAAR